MPENLGIHTSCFDYSFQSKSRREVEHDIGNNLFVFQFTRIDLVFNFTYFIKNVKNSCFFVFYVSEYRPDLMQNA